MKGSRFLIFFSTTKERVLFLLDTTYYGMTGLDKVEILLLQFVRRKNSYLQVMG